MPTPVLVQVNTSLVSINSYTLLPAKDMCCILQSVNFRILIPRQVLDTRLDVKVLIP